MITTLGDLVRLNTDECRLWIAGEPDFAEITAEIEQDRPVKAWLSAWYILGWKTLTDDGVRMTQYQAVGLIHGRRWIITSELRAMSPDRLMIRTQNSIYVLGNPGEWPVHQVRLRVIRRQICEQVPWLAIKFGIDLPIELEDGSFDEIHWSEE